MSDEEEYDAVKKQLKKKISDSPDLLSFLYDLDLLPEQVKEWSLDEKRMLLIAYAWGNSITVKHRNQND